MEIALSVLAGCFFGVAIYLMLSRHLIRILLGVAILGNAANLLIFTAGRLTRDVPPIIGPSGVALAGDIANPLPQALILTAIVISFSIFAFLLVLGFRAYQVLGTDDTEEMRVAEPVANLPPPVGF